MCYFHFTMTIPNSYLFVPALHHCRRTSPRIAPRPGRILHPTHGPLQGPRSSPRGPRLHVILHSPLRRKWSLDPPPTPWAGPAIAFLYWLTFASISPSLPKTPILLCIICLLILLCTGEVSSVSRLGLIKKKSMDFYYYYYDLIYKRWIYRVTIILY